MMSNVLATYIMLGLGAALPRGNNTSLDSQASLLPHAAGFQQAVLGSSRGGNATSCISGLVTVAASTTHNFHLPQSLVPTSQAALTGFIVSRFAPGTPAAPQPDFATVNGTYQIGASLCFPAGMTPQTVEILTHGVGFDRYYWDFGPGYSYVDAAVAAGHAVFYYDRLGNGKSAHPDALEVQAPIQLELARSLIEMLRNGSIGGHPFAHVVAVGHSFGSGISQALNWVYPDVVDATVLTGFGTNNTAIATLGFSFGGQPSIASSTDPYRFGNLSNGYTVTSDAAGLQYQFLSYPGFDPSLLTSINAEKGTQTIGEMAGAPVGGPATNYTKPLVVVNGQNDFPYCLGNCSYPVDQAALVVQKMYPSLKNNSATYLAPHAGHGLNLHFSAQLAYNFIQDFLKQKGL